MTNPLPWTSLHAQVHQTLRQQHLLLKGQRILIAVSGGQDSLCMAQLLLDLQSRWEWQLAIAHCNHRWHAAADAAADAVRSLATAWQIPYHVAVAEPPPTSEAAAREWRYQQLGAIAQAEGYEVVVTGHTASDRAETLLYNLIRGSGIDGLQALAWQRSLAPEVKLVRPLLGVTRRETAQFCQERQLQVWEDPTNQDMSYARNRIRLELLPYLQQHFNPQIETTLAQTAELLRADVHFLESSANNLWQDSTLLNVDLSAPPRINRQVLQRASLALQRRALRQFLQQHLPTSPTFADVEKVVALITAPNRSQTDPFPGGAIARVEDEWIALVSSSETP